MEDEDHFWRRLGEIWQHALIWQEYAAAYDHILLSLGYYRACVARHLRALRRHRAVLDIGGGTGTVAVPLAKAGCDVTVVDPGRAMLDKLRGKIEPGWRGGVRILEQPAEELAALQDASFDAVNILLALYDMDRPEAALQETMRVLRPGGLIVITEPRRTFSLQVLLARSTRNSGPSQTGRSSKKTGARCGAPTCASIRKAGAAHGAGPRTSQTC